jgi:DnaJ-class molecular chaperone
MPDDSRPDYYDLLQISPSAEPETVHRVYRLLAQRFHPDNQESGNERRFRELTEAYHVISDPEKRAEYDVAYTRSSSNAGSSSPLPPMKTTISTPNSSCG